MVSLLNEARLKEGHAPMGFLNPFLYGDQCSGGGGGEGGKGVGSESESGSDAAGPTACFTDVVSGANNIMRDDNSEGPKLKVPINDFRRARETA